MINNPKKLFIKADKSRIIYKMETNNYNKQVDKEVTKCYNATNNETERNKEAKNH